MGYKPIENSNPNQSCTQHAIKDAQGNVHVQSCMIKKQSSSHELPCSVTQGEKREKETFMNSITIENPPRKINAVRYQ